MSTLDIEYTNVEEAAETVFNILKDSIGLNTFFIAKNDGCTVDVLKAFNRNKLLLEGGFQTEFKQSY
jgi:rsbT co-antagonist protein RsbR